MSQSIRSASRVHAAARTQSRGGPILLLIWLATVLFLVIAHSAEAQAPDADADADAEYRFGQLELIYTHGPVALPPVRTDVQLEITGPLIRTVVRQEFSNPTDEVVSARYLYPLPERAAVAAMELQVGERRIVSVVKEKEAARKVYEQARKEGRKAALVSESRRNLFTTEVANIAPGETVHVQLEYLDQVGYEDGWFEFVHPLTFTPRYFPPAGETDPVDAQVRDAAFVRPGDAAFPTARIEVELSPGLELAEIRCPSHEIHKQQTNLQWEIRPDAVEIPADRDFILRWRPTHDPLARPLLFVERTDEALYALLMVVPGDPDPGAPRPAADTVFVLDISGSMGGPSIAQAKSALIAALGQLRAGDRFTVMAFDDRRYVWSEELESVSSGSREDARRWVSRLAARGGTEMHPALLKARRLLDGPETRQMPDAGHARQIVLLTDAAVGNEDQLLRETVAGLGDIRLHVVGIGMAPNRHLVRRLAGEGGGLSLFVGDDSEDGTRLISFLARIGRPQWNDPQVDWRGNPHTVGYPRRLPAPVAGELLLWSGRFDRDVDLAGTLLAGGSGRDLALPLEATSAPAHAGLATRWAQMRVDDLMASYVTNRHDPGADDILRKEIVATALQHGLVTRFTSRVAVELEPSVDQAGDVRDLPAGLPRGSQLMGQLPNGGTLDDLAALVGLALLLTGSTLIFLQRRRSVR